MAKKLKLPRVKVKMPPPKVIPNKKKDPLDWVGKRNDHDDWPPEEESHD